MKATKAMKVIKAVKIAKAIKAMKVVKAAKAAKAMKAMKVIKAVKIAKAMKAMNVIEAVKKKPKMSFYSVQSMATQALEFCRYCSEVMEDGYLIPADIRLIEMELEGIQRLARAGVLRGWLEWVGVA